MMFGSCWKGWSQRRVPDLANSIESLYFFFFRPCLYNLFDHKPTFILVTFEVLSNDLGGCSFFFWVWVLSVTFDLRWLFIYLFYFSQVGFHGEHAYARSLARFAANLGPAGWEIAARQIEKVLPPGTKFGRGWIGEPDPPPQQYQPPLLSTSPLHPSSQLKTPPPPSPVLPKGEAAPERPDGFAAAAAAEDGRHARAPPGSSPAFPGRSGGPSYDGGGFGMIGGGAAAAAAPPPKAPPFQLQQHSTASTPVINGFSAALSSSSSQFGRMLRPPAAAPPPLTHSGVLEMVSRGGGNSVIHAAMSSQPEPANGAVAGDPRVSWRGLSLRSTPESAPPPDLNIRFQSPSSPPAGGGVADSQQPDLALQL